MKLIRELICLAVIVNALFYSYPMEINDTIHEQNSKEIGDDEYQQNTSFGWFKPTYGKIFTSIQHRERNSTTPFKTQKKILPKYLSCLKCRIECHTRDAVANHLIMHLYVKQQSTDHANRLPCLSCKEKGYTISCATTEELINHYKVFHRAFDYWKDISKPDAPDEQEVEAEEQL